MNIRGTIIGVLYLLYEREHLFSKNEIQMLSLYANQTAAAIENTRLIDRFKFLQEINTHILTDLKLDTILESMAEYIANLLGAYRSLFLLFDKYEIHTKKGYNYTEEHLKWMSVDQLMKGLSGWVYRNRKECISKNAQKDKRNKGIARKKAGKHDTGPLIVVPIMEKNEFFGTLTAVNLLGDRKFTKNDLDLAKMLATQAAIAIKNAYDAKKKDNLLHIISHRLKTDVAGPFTFLKKAIQTQSELSSEQLEQIAQRMLDTSNNINDLLQFSVIESGHLKEQTTFFNHDVEDLINSALNTVFPFGTDRVNKNIQKGLKIRVDEKAITHALANIFDNANLYSIPKSIIEIKATEMKEQPGGAVIEIIDQPRLKFVKNELTAIFDKFYRGNHKEFAKGSGLGLYIAKNIIDVHKGEIKAYITEDGRIALKLAIPSH
jgi:K+-sensing histidine kinase KdpD